MMTVITSVSRMLLLQIYPLVTSNSNVTLMATNISYDQQRPAG